MSRPPNIPKLPGKGFLTMHEVPGAMPLANVTRIWMRRAKRLVTLTRPANLHHDIIPFFDDAQAWLDAAAGQLAQAAGSIGPIEMSCLATAAQQLAYSRYWMSVAAANPTDLKLVETASRMGDAATRNMLNAYSQAVHLSRAQARDLNDPLAAFAHLLAKNAKKKPQVSPQIEASTVELEDRADPEDSGKE